jgi:hypothetical protein
VKARSGPGFTRDSNEPIKPLRTLKIEPNQFADAWSAKPRRSVVVGLRLLSSDEETTADVVAKKKATEEYPEEGPDQTAFYNKTLMAWVVARVICDPNDASAGHPTFRAAEDTVPLALTGEAIAAIYDAWELLHAEVSPIIVGATNEEIASLFSISPDTFDHLDRVRANRVRRLLQVVLEDLVSLTTD